MICLNELRREINTAAGHLMADEHIMFTISFHTSRDEWTFCADVSGASSGPVMTDREAVQWMNEKGAALCKKRNERLNMLRRAEELEAEAEAIRERLKKCT